MSLHFEPNRTPAPASAGEGPAHSTWQVGELLRRGAPLFSASVVAVGVFDGVHLGHRRILSEARDLASQAGWTPVALTFDRHPSALLRPHAKPPILNTFEERMRLLIEAGAQHVVVLEFDAELAQFEAEAFLRRVVGAALGARGVVVGRDFRFGRGAAGDAALLERTAAALGWKLRLIEAVKDGGERISSTRVRRCIEQGEVEEAARLLGRAYALEGVVVEGDKLGRKLGYPTANIAPAPGLVLPKDGVYLAEVLIEGEPVRRGLAVVGTRPTVGGERRTVEAHVLDFSGELYGRRLRLEFLSRLRDVQRFDSLDALKAQIALDVEEARRRFAGGE